MTRTRSVSLKGMHHALWYGGVLLAVLGSQPASAQDVGEERAMLRAPSVPVAFDALTPPELPDSSPPSFAVGDTLPAAAESFIRQDFPNGHWGDPPWIRISTARGLTRGLIQFDQDSIAGIVGTGTLDSAILEVTLSDVDVDLPQVIAAHRVTHPWVEHQSTWNCASDPADNGSLDCAPADQWDMNTPANWPFAATATDTVSIGPAPSDSVIQYDVTADVQNFLAGQASNHGWVLKLSNENVWVHIQFWTKEAQGWGFAEAVAPRLALFVTVGDTSRPTVPTTFTAPTPVVTFNHPDGTETYYRDVVNVLFDDSTSGTSVNAFFLQFNATIIGGVPSVGAYVIQIPDPGSIAAQDSVLDAMLAVIGVRSVGPTVESPFIGVSGRFPEDDSTVASTAAWHGATNAFTQSRIAIRLPQAWGCETQRAICTSRGIGTFQLRKRPGM